MSKRIESMLDSYWLMYIDGLLSSRNGLRLETDGYTSWVSLRAPKTCLFWLSYSLSGVMFVLVSGGPIQRLLCCLGEVLVIRLTSMILGRSDRATVRFILAWTEV